MNISPPPLLPPNTESTRRFTKNLLKPGSAAEIRQTACNAVRHSIATVISSIFCLRMTRLSIPQTKCL
uniref:Uncharacterized protein n=1 Tax=Cyprinodon variegatus TaxID=28743 RepID=A0A3Q2D8N4_CYPVA